MASETKVCQNCKQNFTVEPRDFEFYAKIHVPPPTWCPTCRTMRRAMFCNMSQLFRKTEKRTGKVLFSTFPEKSPYEIYEHDYWWSDEWDAIDFGKEVDFSRSFLAQLYELSLAVPRPNKTVRGMVNSDYSNAASYLKNCYLCMNAGFCENCYYSNGVLRTRDSIDAYGLIDSELCYEIFQGTNNYQCFFSSNLTECVDVWFSEDCSGCQNCFGCSGLKQKQYYLFNKQLSKEEYLLKVAELNTGSYRAVQEIKNKARAVALTLPHKYYHGSSCVDVSGDYLFESKNAHDVYESSGVEDSRFADNLAQNIKDCYDYTSWGENASLIYESTQCGDGVSKLKFCINSWPAMQECEYTDECHSSSYLFGCVGLRKKQYCILNKQYEKQEYFALVEKIKKHMDDMPYMDARGRLYTYGEFLPPEFSPLSYNESIAYDYFPMSKEQTEKLGLLWREQDVKEFEVTLKAASLPDHIADAQDSLVQEKIACAKCGRAYRILQAELDFYRRYFIPLPQFCHRCRYMKRISQRNPRKLYERTCMKSGCENKFKTTYSPERPEVIYCESHYNQEVT